MWGVALVTCIGYNAFNEVLAGETAHSLVGVDPRVLYPIFGLTAALIAPVGYDSIRVAQRMLSFLIIVVLLVFTVGVIAIVPFPAGEFGLGQFAATPFWPRSPPRPPTSLARPSTSRTTPGTYPATSGWVHRSDGPTAARWSAARWSAARSGSGQGVTLPLTG